jgi:hypothetical protein
MLITYRFKAQPVAQTLKINAIKTLRELTGMGLKDAKDAVEDMILGKSFDYELDFDALSGRFNFGEIMSNAKQYFDYCEVGSVHRVVLKNLISASVLSEDVDLAVDLLGVFKKNFKGKV